MAGTRTTKNPVATQLGRDLRIYRKRLGISQEALGQRVSLNHTEICLLERGVRERFARTLVKVAGALEVSTNDLLKGIQWRQAVSDGGFELSRTRRD